MKAFACRRLHPSYLSLRAERSVAAAAAPSHPSFSILQIPEQQERSGGPILPPPKIEDGKLIHMLCPYKRDCCTEIWVIMSSA